MSGLTAEQLAEWRKLAEPGVPTAREANIIIALLDEVERLRARMTTMTEALSLADKELDNLAGWSGSSGNWPLQEAAGAVRAALKEE